MITSPILDPLWNEFRRVAATDRKLPGSSVQWTMAHSAWAVLDAFQKQEAIQHLSVCNTMATTHSRPDRYIRERLWEVPEPVARPKKKQESELERRMREA